MSTPTPTNSEKAPAIYICTTRTNTCTPSITPSNTPTCTPTNTPTNTRTPSKTPTNTPTATTTTTITSSITSTITPSISPTISSTNTPTPTNIPILYFTGPQLAEGETSLKFKGKFIFVAYGDQDGDVEWIGGSFEGTGKLLALDDNGSPTSQELSKDYGNINKVITIKSNKKENEDVIVEPETYEVELRWPVPCQPVGELKIPFMVPRFVPSPTPSISRSPTKTPTLSPSITKSLTPSISISASVTPSFSQTSTPTKTNRPTKTPTPTSTPTRTPTETNYANCIRIPGCPTRSTPSVTCEPEPIEIDPETQAVILVGLVAPKPKIINKTKEEQDE